MVTAGVYMVVRSHVLFDRSPFALGVMAIIGAATAFFAATVGMVQTDIKRVLAYSTISQLGYMFLACGAAAYSAAIFHLVTHAFFKGSALSRRGLGHPCPGRRAGHARHGRPAQDAPHHFLDDELPRYLPLRACRRSPVSSARTRFSTRPFSPPRLVRSCGSWVWSRSFLTAFYMFRLWYLAFFGARSGHSGCTASREPLDHAGAARSPGSTCACRRLDRHSPGTRRGDRFAQFLEPVLKDAQRSSTPRAASIRNVSSACVGSRGLIGWFLADLLYRRKPGMATRGRARGGSIRLLLHKYWIDQIYIAFSLPLCSSLSRYVLWGAVDRGLSTAAAARGGQRTRTGSAGAAGAVGKHPFLCRMAPSARPLCSCLHISAFPCTSRRERRSVLNDSILTLTTFVPAAGAVVVALLPRRGRVIQWFTLVVTLVIFGLTLHLPAHLSLWPTGLSI